MKKTVIISILITIIAISASISQKQFIKLANDRAKEVYSATVVRATKDLPQLAVQRITNTSKEKEFLSSWVKQEFTKESFIEKTISGTLLVMYEDHFGSNGMPTVKEGESILNLYLSTPSETYKVENISYPVMENLNGVQVSLTGLLSSVKNKEGYKTFKVNLGKDRIRALKISHSIIKDTRSVKDERGGGGQCTGNFCALVIPMNFSNNRELLPETTELEDYLFGTNGRIKNTLLEQSYGQMDYDGTVIDWMGFQGYGYIGARQTALENLVNGGVNLNDFDHIVFLINDPDGPNGSISGATVGPGSLYVNGIQYSIPLMNIGFANFSTRNILSKANGNISIFDSTYLHETGHTLGASHDNSLLCKNGPSSLPSECIFHEYGNQYSIMGQSSLGGHFSFYGKLRAGWIQESDIGIHQDGIFNLNPLEIPNPTFIGLNTDQDLVPIYVFEYRRPIGVDNPVTTPVNINGLFVYRVNRFNNLIDNNLLYRDPNIVDLSPPLDFSQALSVYTYNDISLRSQNSFFDYPNGFQITGSSSHGQSTLEIEDLGNPTCTLAVPKIFRSSGDFFQQLPVQSWSTPDFGSGSTSPNLSSVPLFQVDNTDPAATINVALTYKLFNDQTIACSNETYHSKILFDGQILSEEYSELIPWSFDWVSMQATLSAYSLSYGQHNLVLEVSQASDSSTVSYDLVFEVEPI